MMQNAQKDGNTNTSDMPQVRQRISQQKNKGGEKLRLPGPGKPHEGRIRAAVSEPHGNRVFKEFPVPGDDEVIIITIGGIGDIGMNLTMYGHKGRWIIVDAGVGFVNASRDSNPSLARRYQTIAEFIDPATFAPVLDRIDGVLFTHCHEDHIGAVPYMFDPTMRAGRLYDAEGAPVPDITLKCPLWATPVAAKMIVNKLPITVASELDIHYFSPGEVFEVGPFQIGAVPVTHSTVEAVAFSIITNQGAIFHTGDWKVEEQPLLGADMDYHSIRALGDSGQVAAVLSDSTNAGRYEENPTTEQDVINGIGDIFRTYDKGRVVVCCFASNVPRIHGLSQAARDAGKTVGVIGSAMVAMQEIVSDEGLSSAIAFTETDIDRLNDVPDNKQVILCTGTQGEPRAALAKMARGNRHLPQLTENDIVIISASVIPGNEASVNAVVEMLRNNGIRVIMGKERLDGLPVHVTGHATAGETRWLYQMLKPNLVIPVHGTDTGLVENAVIASETTEALIPRDGSIIRIHDKGRKSEVMGVKTYIFGDYRN